MNPLYLVALSGFIGDLIILLAVIIYRREVEDTIRRNMITVYDKLDKQDQQLLGHIEKHSVHDKECQSNARNFDAIQHKLYAGQKMFYLNIVEKTDTINSDISDIRRYVKDERIEQRFRYESLSDQQKAISGSIKNVASLSGEMARLQSRNLELSNKIERLSQEIKYLTAENKEILSQCRSTSASFQKE